MSQNAANEYGNVFGAFPERWNRYVKDVQAIVQVLPELVCSHALEEPVMSGRNYAGVESVVSRTIVHVMNIEEVPHRAL